MAVATEPLSLVPDAPSRSLAPVVDKKGALALLSLSPLLFPPLRNPNPKRRHGRELTETPPLAAIDRDLPEQIELGQKLRLALLFLLAQEFVRGRLRLRVRRRLLRLRPSAAELDCLLLRPPSSPSSPPTRSG